MHPLVKDMLVEVLGSIGSFSKETAISYLATNTVNVLL